MTFQMYKPVPSRFNTFTSEHASWQSEYEEKCYLGVIGRSIKFKVLHRFRVTIRLSRLYENVDNGNLYIISFWTKLRSEITALSRHEIFTSKSCF
jgi:hypothetical protein